METDIDWCFLSPFFAHPKPRCRFSVRRPRPSSLRIIDSLCLGSHCFAVFPLLYARFFFGFSEPFCHSNYYITVDVAIVLGNYNKRCGYLVITAIDLIFDVYGKFVFLILITIILRFFRLHCFGD